MEASALPAPHGGRPLSGRSPRSRLADPAFKGGLALVAGLVLVLIAFFFLFLFRKAQPALAHQGVFSFVFTNDWNPSKDIFGGWPLVAGTLITSAIALVIGVPVAVGDGAVRQRAVARGG